MKQGNVTQYINLGFHIKHEVVINIIYAFPFYFLAVQLYLKNEHCYNMQCSGDTIHPNRLE